METKYCENPEKSQTRKTCKHIAFKSLYLFKTKSMSNLKHQQSIQKITENRK